MKRILLLSIAVATLVAFECYAQLVPQNLDFTEDPIDIPNPDRGSYRGRWQNIPPALVTPENSPFGITPEVDHRVPVDASSVLSHGRQVPNIEGIDIELTEYYNGVNQLDKPYIGGTGVATMPSISFMAFDLVNFSSNAFLSAASAFGYMDDGKYFNPDGSPRMGKTQPLTKYALDYIRGLLQTVRDSDAVAFVKFSYDGNGFNYIESFKYPELKLTQGIIHDPEPGVVTGNNPSAMCTVPGHEDKNWVEYHIWQLGPIFHEFEDVIMCIKTGMLGPWGEQHSSKMSISEEDNKMLMDAFLEVAPSSRLLLTKQPVFTNWYNLTYNTSYDPTNIDTMPTFSEGTPESRIGFFNDSYANGYADGGRFRGPGDRTRYRHWIHERNVMFQIEGGISDNVFGHMPGAIIEAQGFRVNAVNMRHGNYGRWADFVYNEENVTKPVTFPNSARELEPPFTGPTVTAVFDPVYDGRSGLEYMRDRFGYRLVLREATASKTVKAVGGILEFKGKIQNVGFGNVVNKKSVSVVLKSKTGTATYTALLPVDARAWTTDEAGNTRADNVCSWRNLDFSVKMGEFGSVPAGEYDIYLKINDPKEQSANRRCIRFANKGGMWNAQLGANRIGSTMVN